MRVPFLVVMYTISGAMMMMERLQWMATPTRLYTRGFLVKNGGMASGRQKELQNLDPALRARIRRTITVSSIWFGLIIVSAGVFVISKPYIDKKREERLKQPGYKPLVTPKYPKQSSVSNLYA